jgi:hypothetical protein
VGGRADLDPRAAQRFHQLLVPARIDGSPPLWCELDSGGGGALVFIEAAKASAIGIQATSFGRSAGPRENTLELDGRAQVTLAFPGLTIPGQELVIKPASLPGDKDASVGMLVLSRFVVELDHDHPAVRLHERMDSIQDWPRVSIHHERTIHLPAHSDLRRHGSDGAW